MTATKVGSATIRERVAEALAYLKKKSSTRNREGMARYGIVAPKVFGVSLETLRQKAKTLGPDHELAVALWKTGWYDARMLAALIDEPARVTPAQMDRWCRDFDNWGICDTVCFHLFDKTPHAYKKVVKWADGEDEFVRRAAFALAASLAAHDKRAPDSAFTKMLPLVRRAASDNRNFVKKGVSWALRAIGNRSPKLHAASVKLAHDLKSSPAPAARWIGSDAYRDLTRPLVLRRVAARADRIQRSKGPKVQGS